jgi:acyl-CoA synthetase (AMP-forming)/AMP-acid ligase II
MKYIFSAGFILAKKEKHNILPIDIFEKTADKYRDKTMIIYKDTSYSYAKVDRMANKIANVALGLGLKQGDTVAMLMYNEPTFIWTWLGL